MEIKCSTCRRCKDESNFALDSTSITGRARNCKVCHSSYAREHYKRNRAKVLAQTKKRYVDNPSIHREYMAIWRKSVAGKDSRYRETLEQRRKFPEKHEAHLAVQRALRAKELVKQPCSVCGTKEYIHAHHEDYNKPLDVQWLCRKHHHELHQRLKVPQPQAEVKTVEV